MALHIYGLYRSDEQSFWTNCNRRTNNRPHFIRISKCLYSIYQYFSKDVSIMSWYTKNTVKTGSQTIESQGKTVVCFHSFNHTQCESAQGRGNWRQSAKITVIWNESLFEGEIAIGEIAVTPKPNKQSHTWSFTCKLRNTVWSMSPSAPGNLKGDCLEFCFATKWEK